MMKKTLVSFNMAFASKCGAHKFNFIQQIKKKNSERLEPLYIHIKIENTLEKESFSLTFLIKYCKKTKISLIMLRSIKVSTIFCSYTSAKEGSNFSGGFTVSHCSSHPDPPHRS